LNTTTFDSLGIGAPLCRALAEIGYQTPTPIQAKAIPELLEGRDLLGIAQTGTGKTAAFSLPILQQLADGNVKARPGRPRVLVLAPTRELAAQICDDIAGYARHTPIRYARIFGGVNQNPQIKMLSRGIEVLIATPGRLLDLVGQKHLDLSDITHLVLDEADRLLDMGFIRDVRRVVKLLPRDRQSLLFSATMPKEVAELANDILDRPVRVDISPKTVTVERIEQRVLMVDNDAKQQALQKLLHEPDVTRVIVFTRTKHGANRVTKKLYSAGIEAEAIHGNKSQNARQRALDNFKSGASWVLVATDIAARGIDIDGISHIINFELPHEPESYVHRIGRTARAGTSGVAWSLVDPSEVKRLRAIERLTRVTLEPMAMDLPTTASAPPAARENGNGRQRQGEARSGNGAAAQRPAANGSGRRRPRRRRRARAE